MGDDIEVDRIILEEIKEQLIKEGINCDHHNNPVWFKGTYDSISTDKTYSCFENNVICVYVNDGDGVIAKYFDIYNENSIDLAIEYIKTIHSDNVTMKYFDKVKKYLWT